jgi:signal peptidase I
MPKSKIALTIIAVLAFAGCGSAGTRVYRVPSQGMAPTYEVGSRIVVKLDAYRVIVTP